MNIRKILVTVVAVIAAACGSSEQAQGQVGSSSSSSSSAASGESRMQGAGESAAGGGVPSVSQHKSSGKGSASTSGGNMGLPKMHSESDLAGFGADDEDEEDPEIEALCSSTYSSMFRDGLKYARGPQRKQAEALIAKSRDKYMRSCRLNPPSDAMRKCLAEAKMGAGVDCLGMHYKGGKYAAKYTEMKAVSAKHKFKDDGGDPETAADRAGEEEARRVREFNRAHKDDRRESPR